MTRDQVILEARKWLGVRWRHQGRSRHGVDCVGLLVVVGAAFGLPIEDRTDYARDPVGTHMLQHLRRHLVLVRPGENPLGVVGIFRQSRFPCHVGILSTKNGHPHVIHARTSLRSVIEEPLVSGRADLNLVEMGAFPGLED